MLHVPEECLIDDLKNKSFEEKLAYTKENFDGYEDVNQHDAIDFYLDGVDEQKLRDYFMDKRKRPLNDLSIAMWGLQEMLENEIIKPACVDWPSFVPILLNSSDIFIEGLDSHRIQYETIKCIYKQRDLILRNTFNSTKKDLAAKWKAWVEKYKDLAKLEQEQQKEKAKQAKQATKPPKEKPEYIVSLEEMLEYYSNEGDSLIAFINHCVVNKEDWLNKAVQNMIRKAQVAHHNTFNIKGNYNEIQGNTNLTIKNE